MSVADGALADGTVSVAVDMTDDAGNSTSAATSFDLDTTLTVPAIGIDSVINDAESGSVEVTLSGVDGDVDPDTGVVVTLTDANDASVTASYTAESGTWIADAQTLTDGDVVVSATVTDDAGNEKSAELVTIDLDTTADAEDGIDLAVAVDSVINDEESGNVTLTLSGVDADAVSVSVTLTDGTDSVSATAESDNNGAWTVSVADGALADGTVSVAVDMTDDAGNSTSAATSFDLDTTLTVPAIGIDSVINDAESGSVEVTLSGVDGDVDPDTGVVVTLTDANDASVTASYTAESGTWIADAQTLTDGDVVVSATVTDDAGNEKSAAPVTIDLDTTADAEDGIDLAVAVDSVINDEESGNVTLTLSGVDADAVSVSVTLTDGTDSVSATAESDNNGAWTVSVADGALADGTVSVAVDMTDDAGNSTSAATSFDLTPH